MLYNQNKACVKSCQKHCFPKKPLFSNMCTCLSHCFEMKNYHWVEPLKCLHVNTDIDEVITTLLLSKCQGSSSTF